MGRNDHCAVTMRIPSCKVSVRDLDRFIMRCMGDWRVPGVAVGIVKHGRVIHAKGYGRRDVARDVPVTEHTNFYIGSCTKAFTATAIGMLVDEGTLEWDKPVRDYLPSFRMYDRVATAGTTPRDLLTHRTGLPNHFAADQARDRRKLLKLLRHLEPSADFRARFQYCNKMYIVAGLLIEHVTGSTWERFVKQRIFEPLQMTSSKFAADITYRAEDGVETDELSVGYLRRGSRLVPWFSGWAKELCLAATLRAIGPDGAIISNVTDMCRWLRMQMNGGMGSTGPVISQRSLREIHSPQVAAPGRWSDGRALLDASYAMGWFVQPYRGYRYVCHGGGGSGFSNQVSFIPEESLGVIVLTNESSSWLPTIITLNVYDRLLGMDPIAWNARLKQQVSQWQADSATKRRKAARQRQRNTQPSLPLRQYTGQYEHPGYDGLCVFLDGGQLKLKHRGWPYELIHYRLKHYHCDIFQMDDPPGSEFPKKKKASFAVRKSRAVESVAINFEPSVGDIVFKKVRG